MQIALQGRIGIILLLLFAIVFGLSMALGVGLPAVVMGMWLVIGAILALVGV